MATEWIPNYIKRTIDYKPKDILTAQEYNAILNLIITQGDYNSSWLEYLQDHGIPDAVAELAAEEIADAITAVVRQEIDALTASVQTKTSKQLDNAAVTILNIGQEYSGIYTLNTLLAAKNLKASYAVAVNLIGLSGAYPTLTQLTDLKTAGNDILAYGTDGTALTAEDAATKAGTAFAFVNSNNFNSDVFIYPSGNSSDAVSEIVGSIFKYAANASNSGVLLPEDYLSIADYSVLCNLPIKVWDNTIDIEDMKDYIDDVVEHNQYMILQINTDLSTYDTESFEAVLNYLHTKSLVEYPESITEQMYKIHNTIENQLVMLKGTYITDIGGVKYLNW